MLVVRLMSLKKTKKVVVTCVNNERNNNWLQNNNRGLKQAMLKNKIISIQCYNSGHTHRITYALSNETIPVYNQEMTS